jgi:cytoskeletal protein CcmA (bactofilin family)
MADATVIGQGAFVRGHIRGDGDLEIHGRVEGDIEIDGEVTIGDGALVRADVTARRVVVRGAVAGNLSASLALRLEEGARVVGDLRSPTIGVAKGALVRGHVQTGEAGAARKTEAASHAARTETRAAARTPERAPSRPAARPELRAVTRASASTEAANRSEGNGGSTKASRAAPPPPLVPALKRGTRGSMKKRGAH